MVVSKVCDGEAEEDVLSNLDTYFANELFQPKLQTYHMLVEKVHRLNTLCVERKVVKMEHSGLFR